MVTKAVSQVFGNNIEGMLFCVAGSSTVSWSDYFLPICPNTIGGILLFQDAITEDENTIYAPSSNQCIGYASNDVNATANVLRGSLNLTESKATDKGYKFVWDFTTSQGNGTITAVCLTHKQGGVGYFGDSYDAEKRLLRMMSGNDDALIRTMMQQLKENGSYTIPASLKEKIQQEFCGYWTSEKDCAAAMQELFKKEQVLIDPHTAVALHAMRQYQQETKDSRPCVVLSTASPYKFSHDVLKAVAGKDIPDDFAAMEELQKISDMKIPAGLAELKQLPVRFEKSIEVKDGMHVIAQRMKEIAHADD